MNVKSISCVALAWVVVLGADHVARAQQAAGPGNDARPRQRLNLLLGRFVPRGETEPPFTQWQGRARGDALVSSQIGFLPLDMVDFRSGTIGAEWLVPFGTRIEIGTSVGLSTRTVHTPYPGDIEPDGTEIIAERRLRIVPISFTARVLPLGPAFRLQPYVGGGVAFFSWKYEQSGEYADYFNFLSPELLDQCTSFECPFNVFKPPPQDLFTISGTEPGAVLLGGLRFTTRAVSVGGEIRYHRGAGEFDQGTTLLHGSSVDLGGMTYQLTVGVRFP